MSNDLAAGIYREIATITGSAFPDLLWRRLP
jgi:hypothetical protein